VTDIGLVTPLGIGTQHVWQRLINGDIGVASSPSSIAGLAELPSRVCAVVPRGPASEHSFDPKEWVPRDLISVASPFIQFALG
jgi:3-oxoacyl-[acyl-carrier-protein] synthase II